MFSLTKDIRIKLILYYQTLCTTEVTNNTEFKEHSLKFYLSFLRHPSKYSTKQYSKLTQNVILSIKGYTVSTKLTDSYFPCFTLQCPWQPGVQVLEISKPPRLRENQSLRLEPGQIKRKGTEISINLHQHLHLNHPEIWNATQSPSVFMYLVWLGLPDATEYQTASVWYAPSHTISDSTGICLASLAVFLTYLTGFCDKTKEWFSPGATLVTILCCR